MKAREVMTTAVATVSPETSVHEAAELMRSRDVTSLPVLDEDGRVIGIVSESDILRDRLPHDPRAHLRNDRARDVTGPDPARFVADVMTAGVLCVGTNADLADVATTMVDNGVRAVPVVDGARLAGIVSRRDALRTLLREDADIRAEFADRLAEYDPAREWNVSVKDGVATVKGRHLPNDAPSIVRSLAASVPGLVRLHLH